MKHDIRNRNTQRGAVLAIGLILLAVATLVTLTAMNTGVMQESMTANQDNNARSFMAAEAGGAELVSWVNAQLKEHGKLTGAPALLGTVGGDSSITYKMDLHPDSASWTSFPLKVLIEGRTLAADNATVLARTELLVEWREPTRTGPNPPAAISCFHGPCSIRAGAGRGASEGYGTISGFNHPVPSYQPKPCGGKGCRTKPIGDDMTAPVVPAVFFGEGAEGSSVGIQGGVYDAYEGLGPDGEHVIGQDESVAVKAGDAIYPPDDNGNSTAPTWESVFNGEEPKTDIEIFSYVDDKGKETITKKGILVVDTDFEMKGTSLFDGVIVIRNCGSITMGGNPNVYGAIIIDAVNADGNACTQPYDPFKGNGTPAVRFVGGPGGGGSSVGTGGTGITIWTEYHP